MFEEHNPYHVIAVDSGGVVKHTMALPTKFLAKGRERVWKDEFPNLHIRVEYIYGNTTLYLVQ